MLDFASGITPETAAALRPLASEAAALSEPLIALSNLNSGSFNVAGVNATGERFAELFAPLGASIERLPLAPYIAEMNTSLGGGCDVRTLGSGALDLGFVAAGRLDGAFYRHINLWDVAGGLAIAIEAGATASDFLGGEGMTKGNAILVTTPELYAPLHAMFLEG